METLIFAIIGFGKMGHTRYRALQAISDCQVKWIYEPAPDIALPEGIQRASTVSDIFNDSDVQAIVVATPNNTLKEYVVQGLMYGKHVFCEKPPGRNLAELNEMMATEACHPNLKLMFGFNHRHHESMIMAKRLVDSGEYGKLLWMRGRYGKSVNKEFFSTWRAKKEIAGGGIFLDQGIHLLDLFLMLCGNFDEVKAEVSNLYWQLDIEDNVFAIFKNKKGQVASLHSTMTQWRHIFSLEIFLERGYITINGLKTSTNSYGEEVMTIAKNRTLPPEAKWTDEEEHVFPVDRSWQRELNIFVEAIRQDKKIPVGNTQDAHKLMVLAEKVYAGENLCKQSVLKEKALS